MGKMFRIEAPHFTAGFELDKNGYIRRAAPILKWAKGKHINEIKSHCFIKGWKIAQISYLGDSGE